MFENGFPIELNSELHRGLENISKTTYTNCFSGTMDTASNEQYELLDGTVIDFPYRIYFIDDDSLFLRLTTLNERLISPCRRVITFRAILEIVAATSDSGSS